MFFLKINLTKAKICEKVSQGVWIKLFPPARKEIFYGRYHLLNIFRKRRIHFNEQSYIEHKEVSWCVLLSGWIICFYYTYFAISVAESEIKEILLKKGHFETYKINFKTEDLWISACHEFYGRQTLINHLDAQTWS